MLLVLCTHLQVVLLDGIHNYMTEQDLIKSGMPPKPSVERAKWLNENGYATVRPHKGIESSVCKGWPRIHVLPLTAIGSTAMRFIIPAGLFRKLMSCVPKGCNSGWPARDGEIAQRVAPRLYVLWSVVGSEWRISSNAINIETCASMQYDIPADEFQLALVEARLTGSPRSSNRG